MQRIGHKRIARRNVAAVLASLAGLLLTHGVAIACILYCLAINPAQPLLAHHHHHPGMPAAPIEPHQSWQPFAPAAPVLGQGIEIPLIVPALAVLLLGVRSTRWIQRFPTPRFASWIAPLAAPPPRLPA